MKKYNVIFCVCLIVLTGCSAYLKTFTTISKDSVAFKSSQLKSGGMAVVPISGGNRAYHSTIKENVDAKLSEKLGTSFLSTSKTAQKLNDENLVQVFRNTINTYEETGISEQKSFFELGKALGVRYLLRITLQDISSQKEVEGTDGDIYTNESREGRINALLWDCKNGSIVWEGSAWTEAEENMLTVISQSNHEFLGRASRALVNRIFKH